MFYDTNWAAKCKSALAPSLYPGEITGQILCTAPSSTAGEKLEFMIKYFNNYDLSPERLVVTVLPELPAKVAPDFKAFEGTTIDIGSSQVLELAFRLIDNSGSYLVTTT